MELHGNPIQAFIVALLSWYRWLLLARVLLSWMRINWYDMPWRILYNITEPVLTPFQRLIPPIGGLDLSPIILFLLLDLLIVVIQGLPLG